MLVVVRDGKELSQKVSYVLQLFKLIPDSRILYVYRKGDNPFGENWKSDKIELATTASGILANYMLMILKSPHDLFEGFLSRLFGRRRPHVLFNEGFLSVLSLTFYYYFATRARTHEILNYLTKQQSSKTILIDEFWSIKTINLKTLERLGKIIYVSQDVAYNRYGFHDYLITRELMYRLEQEAVAHADLVVACSERDELEYINMGAKKTVFYPNIYPLKEFEPIEKDQSPSVCVVSRSHWGSKLDKSSEEIFSALASVKEVTKVYVIGTLPKQLPKNIKVKHYPFMPSKLNYLNILAKSWIGINIGFHLAGTNERKYDYAMAGLVVFSDTLGARGDLLPTEYVYVDSNDLSAKLRQLLQFGREKLLTMGELNRKQALFLAETQREKLKASIVSLDFPTC